MSTLPVTLAEFKEAMPARLRKNVNQGVLDYINNGITDPEVLAVYRENVVGLVSVMSEGRFKLDDYLSAVKFVSYQLLRNNQIDAWAKTFPARYNNMVAAQKTRSEIASVASRYGGSKLVVMLMGQTMMPTHILNAPLFQEALNTQAALMRDAKSEMVRMQAAGKLMEILKPPEVQKVELDIGVKEDESLKQLRAVTLELAREQRKAIESGAVSVNAIAESKIVEAEKVEVL